MIKLTGLTKRYPGRSVTANAVDGIDLEIPEGKLVTLLGPSGCGKTTTLRLIAGLERADAGVIEIGGQVVSDPARRVFVGPHQRPIGIVFQSYAIWPHMNVIENVEFPLKVAKPRPEAAGRPRAGHARRSTSSAWPTSPSGRPRPSPAASSSASRWPGRSSANPRCCCSTSR